MSNTKIIPTVGNLYGNLIPAIAPNGISEDTIQTVFRRIESLEGEIESISSICIAVGITTVVLTTKQNQSSKNLILYITQAGNETTIRYGEQGETTMIDLYKNTSPVE